MEIVTTFKSRLTGRASARLGSFLAVGALAFAGIAHAQSPETDAAVKAHAERLTVTICGTCHGREGRSELPKFPNLAGQNANYLAAQLRAFKNQTRGDPDAVGYMWGMASQLDEPVIEALAAYYSAQRPAAGTPGDPAKVSQGAAIFTKGLEGKGVPACAGCHGADAHGTADFPRLAGQHAQYVVKQLTSFRNAMRDVAAMHVVAKDLTPEEIQAVAEYVQAQQ